MKYFHDEPGRKEMTYLVPDDFSPVFGEAAERLLHRPCSCPNMQRVLSQLPRHSLQILCGPCKDIPILTEEVGELAFLFVIQACTNGDGALWELIANLDLICLLSRLEGYT